MIAVCDRDSMEPPPPPIAGRFRLRVKIYPAAAAEDQDVSVKRSILIAKGPKLPLPELTIRELCEVILKRYKQIYPSESLFNIHRSQDEGGSDLYLDDRVGDVFADNEVFRIVQGSSIRESLPPDSPAFSYLHPGEARARSVSIAHTSAGTKKRELEESPCQDEIQRREKRQKVGKSYQDRPILSLERDTPELDAESTQLIENDTVVPETQCSIDEPMDVELTQVPVVIEPKSPQLGPTSKFAATNSDDDLGDQDQEHAKIPSPASSTGSTRGESVFSNEASFSRGRKLKIRATPKKRLVSQERSLTRSTAGTTPTHQEPPMSPSLPSTTIELIEKPGPSKPRQGLRRPTLYASNKSRGSSASKVYDEIEETDRDEPRSVPKKRKEALRTNHDDKLPTGVSTYKFKTKSKQSPDRSQMSSPTSSSQFVRQSSVTTKATVSANTQEIGATRLHTDSPKGNHPGCRQQEDMNDNSLSLDQEGVDGKARQELEEQGAEQRKEVDSSSEQNKSLEAKARANSQLNLAEEKQAQEREEAATDSTRKAEARAKANEAEVVRLVATAGQTAPSKTQLLDLQDDHGNRLVKNEGHQQYPISLVSISTQKETRIPPPKPLTKRSSTPFIPQGRSVSRLLKPPASGSPSPPVSKANEIGDQQPFPPSNRKISFLSSQSSAPKCSQILPPKRQMTLVPSTSHGNNAKVSPKANSTASNPQTMQRTLHKYSRISRSDSVPAPMPLCTPLTATHASSASLSTIGNASQTVVKEILTEPAHLAQLPSFSTSETFKAPKSSGNTSNEDSESGSASQSDLSDEESSSCEDSEEEETIMPTTSSLLSSSALQATSQGSSFKASGYIKHPATQTPSLKRMCEELRSRKSSDTKPILPPAKLFVAKRFSLAAKNDTAASDHSETDSSDSDSDESVEYGRASGNSPDKKETGVELPKRDDQPVARRTYSDLEESAIGQEDEMNICRKDLSRDIADFVPGSQMPLSSAVQPPSSSPSLMRAIYAEERKKKPRMTYKAAFNRALGRQAR